MNENKRRYEIIKNITKALRKEYKGIQSNSYGYCCNSDYDAYHDYINNEDYVCTKLYKGGLNNDYDYDKKEFKIYSEIYFSWCLTNFELNDIIGTMNKAIEGSNAKIIKPLDTTHCIVLKFN